MNGFTVIDKTTGKTIDADDYADEYWEVQTQWEKTKEGPQPPYLFYRKCSWILEEDGCLCIGDSCGNFVYVDMDRFEAVMKGQTDEKNPDTLRA